MEWQLVSYKGFGEGKPKFRVLAWFESDEELDTARVLAGLYLPSLLLDLSDSCLKKDFWSYDLAVSQKLLDLKERLRRSYESV